MVLLYHTWKIRQESPADWTPSPFNTGHTYRSEFSQRIEACCSSTPLKENENEGAQSCPTLCNPMDCSLPSFSVHGVFQAKILEWVAISFSRGSSQSRDGTQVSGIVGRCFTLWATREAHYFFLAPMQHKKNLVENVALDISHVCARICFLSCGHRFLKYFCNRINRRVKLMSDWLRENNKYYYKLINT